MASYVQVESLMDEATDALSSGDYETAEVKATAALGVLSVLPIDARQEGHASGSYRYSELLINQFIERARNLAGRKAQNSNPFGIQTAKTRFASGRCGEYVEDCQ